MTYAFLIEPNYGEDPRQHNVRVRELDRILASVSSAADDQAQQRTAQLALASVFQMETVE